MKEVNFLKHWHLKYLGFSALTMIFLFASCSSGEKENVKIAEPKTVLKLSPSGNNPRNSEGDFINLKDGRVLFVYSR